MKKVLGTMLLGIILFLTSCYKDRVTGGGIIITEDRFNKNFTMVSMAGSTNVTVFKGTDFSVKVKGYSNLLPYFETKVVNGSLELGFKDHVNIRNDNIEVFVTVPVLNGLSVAGSGDIIATGNFTNNVQFETNIAGSGNISLERGTASNFSAKIVGSGSVNAFGFTAEKVIVKVSGSGNTEITANDKLAVQIAGSGNVYYKGSPEVTVSISGSGKVIKR